MEQPNPFKDTIEEIIRSQQRTTESLKDKQDVKDGKTTVEEEQEEPGYLLYNQIANSMMDILKQPEITNGFVEIGKKLGADISTTLVNIISIATVTASHNAIVFYDELLKKELTNQLQFFGGHLNECKADITAYKSVLEVFKKRLDTIEKQMKLDEIKKTGGLKPDNE